MIIKAYLKSFARFDLYFARKIYTSNLFQCELRSYSDNKDNESILLEQIFKGIVGETKDFFIIDKPAKVSLFRSKPLTNLRYNGLSSAVTVDDILPKLCEKLQLNPESLHISSELPYEFSGLFILSKNRKHFEITKNYYEICSAKKFPGYSNQSYRCLCWNQPVNPVSDVAPFSYTYYRPDENNYQYEISFKVDKTQKKSFGMRKFWTKRIGHELMSQANDNHETACLIDVSCNSTYRGVIPLYLLHQGCIVLGEYLQSSRLSSSRLGGNVYILPPERADGSKSLPVKLKQKLGEYAINLSAIPVLVHCNKLMVPSATNAPKTKEYLGKSKFNFNSNSSLYLNWESSLKLNVISYYSLPELYGNIMKQLDVPLPFDEVTKQEVIKEEVSQLAQ